MAENKTLEDCNLYDSYWYQEEGDAKSGVDVINSYGLAPIVLTGICLSIFFWMSF